jgi:hypothetical protein
MGLVRIVLATGGRSCGRSKVCARRNLKLASSVVA